MTPLISICIPAFNAATFLPETLASVAKQTFTDWELIVTEDGSSDQTRAIVETFSQTVPQHVAYTRNPSNLGLPATRNAGIQVSAGKWIALLDSDDLWQPDHLKSLTQCARANPQRELIHSGCILFESRSGKPIEKRAPTPTQLSEFPFSLLRGIYIVQPSSILMKKSLWRRVGGFDPLFRFAEDREMWLRCARAGASFAFTGSCSCLYRKHSEALSTKAAEMAEASAAILDRHIDWSVAPSSVRKDMTAEMWAAAGKLRRRTAPSLSARYFHYACVRKWRLDWTLFRCACRFSALKQAFFRGPDNLLNVSHPV